MVYYLCEALDDAVEMAESRKTLPLNEYQRKAVGLLTDILRGNKSVPLAAVQGPPGTGKTTVVEAFVEQKGGLADFLLEEAGYNDEVIVYTAPTNHLAWDAFRRVTAALIRKGLVLRDIIDIIRIYGSKIRPCRPGYKPKSREVGEVLDRVDELMSRQIDVSKVKLVFAVEFQRVSSRFMHVPSKIHFVVDEASKTPFYRFFLPVADAIVRKPGTYPASLMVLGDPEQAITVPEEFRLSRVKLLMRKVIGLLRETGLEDQHVMLSVTYRLPKPSEKPISYGYYDNRLKGYYRLQDRKLVYELLDTIARERSRIEKRLQSASGLWDEKTKRILDALVQASSSDVPLIIIETRSFQSRALPTLDVNRIELAVRTAAILAIAIDVAGVRVDVAVTAPYSDMVANASYKLRYRLGSIPAAKTIFYPVSATVQSMIGGEADIIITMLGKEWGSGGDYFETIYEREPEVLNVQLSRHRGLEVVIGDIRRLSRFNVRKVAKTASKMLELTSQRQEGREGAIIVRVS